MIPSRHLLTCGATAMAITLTLVLVLPGATAAMAEEPPQAKASNLIANGSFNENIEGWIGRIVDRQRDNERVPRPDFVEHIVKEKDPEQDDEAANVEESEGILQITLDDLGYDTLAAHQSGVHVLLTESVPEGSRLRIRFDARTLGGSPLLRITRAWGGSSYDQLAELTKQWQTHEIVLSLSFDTTHLIWTLVEGDTGAASNRVAMGRCQIDNVHISVVDESEGEQED